MPLVENGLGSRLPCDSVMTMKRESGFTLIELIMVVMVIAIMTAVAIPSFQNLSASNRIMKTVNEFVGTFQQARAEALSRSASVTIRAISDDWQNGWRIEPDGVNCDVVACTVFDAPNPNTTVTAGATSYQYNAQGRLMINSELSIDICDKRDQGRAVVLTPIGRAFVQEANISCP